MGQCVAGPLRAESSGLAGVSWPPSTLQVAFARGQHPSVLVLKQFAG